MPINEHPPLNSPITKSGTSTGTFRKENLFPIPTGSSFGEKREVELVWNGKTNEVCTAVLPFQIIEQVDEPREEKDTKIQQTLDVGYDSNRIILITMLIFSPQGFL